MGHGAPKRVSTIPTETVVKIYAWEGMLYEAQRKLGDVLKSILSGDDSPNLWNELDSARKATVFYSQQYTKAILGLQLSQNRG